MKSLAGLLIFTFLISYSIRAQQQGTSTLPDQHLFDFWVGTWNLSWQSANGDMESGTNKIEWVLNDKVIKENFEATSGSLQGYIGKSWSVYNSRTGEWKQTWVDNQGGYLDFTGRKEGEKRFFERAAVGANGEPVKQRMVFYNIKEDSFTWDWERSNDDGANWSLQWRIQYQRAK